MKTIISVFLLIFILSPVLAATDDFTALGDNITVSGVVGDVTADMLIMENSTAASWEFDSGTFTVTDPGTFMVGSSDSSVKSIKFMQGSANLACTANSDPGNSYATAPTASGTYTVTPSTTTNCTSLCTAIANAASYNSFPTCGAATCNSGYELSGSGASATCTAVSSGSSGIPLTILNQINQNNQEQNTEETTPEPETTPTTEPETTPGTSGEPATDSQGNITLAQMLSEAQIINTADVKDILIHMDTDRNNKAEVNYNKTIVNKITSGSNPTSANINKITNFVTYGTQSTLGLGAGERGGVVNSFKSAFGKLPTTEADWNDVIKIANGRWPNQRSESAEDRAKANFKIVYKREPNRSNPHDDAAITVMAYGLRPANRNLDSEKNAIKFFKAIYGYNPEKATAWDVVRAIAYSGATR